MGRMELTKRIQQLETTIEEAKKSLEVLKAELDKPEYKVGDWVKMVSGDLVRLEKAAKKKGDFVGCGISINQWLDNGYNWRYHKIDRKATKYEIEQALIKEAKRRGFSSCKSWKYAKTGYTNFYAGGDFYYDEKKDLLDMDGGTVYFKGKWAEIVEDTTFFDWDVERTDLGRIVFAPDCEAFFFEEEDMQTIISALEYVKHKKVSEVLTELKKLDL